MNTKKLAAEKAVEYIQQGMIVGLGTGSTAYWAIQAIGRKVQEGLNIQAIATSDQSEQLARELNIPLIPFNTEIDLTIDGADEVDQNLDLIKGGGGALLREKLVAINSKQFIVIVDESKKVNNLGKFPLPIEIVKYGFELTLKQLQRYGVKLQLRLKDNKLFTTDNGNYIVDGYFGEINNPTKLHEELKSITGVVETGLFVDLPKKVIVAYESGEIKILE